MVLLDASVAETLRLAELARVEQAANDGDANAQHTAGSLYRLGRNHPANLVDQDDDRASRYLSNAALGGNTFAMAGMAELKLRNSDDRSAQVWAQVFSHYESVRMQLVEPSSANRRAYTASLLQRCFARTGSDDETMAAVNADAQAFIDRHDSRIRQAIALAAENDARSATEQGLRPISSNTRRQRPRMRLLDQPGMALYRIGVDESGRVEKTLVIDSLPDESFARALGGVASGSRFDPAPVGTGLRWAVSPIVYDDQSVWLRSEAEQ